MGPHRHDPVRTRPALFAFSDNGIVARDLVHADRMGRGAVRAADRAQLVSPLGGRLGAHRRFALGPLRRRAYRGGDQAGLSRNSGAARTAPSGAGARARAGAFRRWGRAKQLPRGLFLRTVAALGGVVIARTAMTPAAAMQRKAIGLAAAVCGAVLALRLRCSAGDERRQTGVVACFRLRHARLIEALLRLRVARLIGT